jgi:hypothetical protein
MKPEGADVRNNYISATDLRELKFIVCYFREIISAQSMERVPGRIPKREEAIV